MDIQRNSNKSPIYDIRIKSLVPKGFKTIFMLLLSNFMLCSLSSKEMSKVAKSYEGQNIKVILNN